MASGSKGVNGMAPYSASRAQLVEEGDEGDENKERGNWTGKLDFILSCLGYAVGLGNVWRFPFMCYRNGGGAFLIPYVIMLMFVGVPLFFLELSIGQFSSMSPIVGFGRAVPIFEGIGYGMVVISAFVAIYYNMIIAWTLYYLISSLTLNLPWDSCGNPWNSETCFNKNEEEKCSGIAGTYLFGQCFTNQSQVDDYRDLRREDQPSWTWCLAYDQTNEKNLSISIPDDCVGNNRLDFSPNFTTQISPLASFFYTLAGTDSAEEFLTNQVLRQSEGIHQTGTIQWQLALALLGAWIIVYLCMIKGIKSSGRVVYFTATFPYLVIVILLIRGVTLDGAIDGIRFYMVPDFDKLSDSKVWSDAAGQIFFSLGVAFGGLMTLASYNKFETNVVRDTAIVAFGNCLTSVFAGFAIFSIMGFMAKDLGKEVHDVVQSGTGLAFIAYPTAVARMWAPTLWAILFFFMLLTLGIDSQFAMVETVLTAILDKVPRWRSKKPLVCLVICVVGFILGLTMTTNGGVYWLTLMDTFAGSYSVLLLALCEGICVAYVYGLPKFLRDVQMMIGRRGSFLKPYWYFTTYFTVPVLIFGILGFTFYSYSPPTEGSYVYHTWAQVIGWMICALSAVMVPVLAIYNICTKYEEGETTGETIRRLMKPKVKWGPYLDRYRTGEYRPLGLDNLTDGHHGGLTDHNGHHLTGPYWQGGKEHLNSPM